MKLPTNYEEVQTKLTSNSRGTRNGRRVEQNVFEFARLLDNPIICVGAGDGFEVECMANALHFPATKENILGVEVTSERVKVAQSFNLPVVEGAAENLPEIVGDKKYNIDSPIVIGTMQSLKNKIVQLNKEFGTIIVDECHHIPATVFKGIIDAFYARYKLGLTATAWRKDGKHILLHNYLGGLLAEIKTKDSNRLDPTIYVVHTDIKLSSNPMIPWQTRVNELYLNPNYVELFLDLCQIQARKGHLVLALSDRVDFLRECHELLEDSFLVVGDTIDRDFLASKKGILLGTARYLPKVLIFHH